MYTCTLNPLFLSENENEYYYFDIKKKLLICRFGISISLCLYQRLHKTCLRNYRVMAQKLPFYVSNFTSLDPPTPLHFPTTITNTH